MRSAIPATVGILTFNSQRVVGEAIRSAAEFDEIVVCDGGSTDGTRDLATSMGCRVVDQAPEHLDSKGRLIDIAGVREQVVGLAKHDWVLFLDSDEILTAQLVEEIRGTLVGAPTFGGYQVPRLYTLGGKVIDCAMSYPTHQIRLVNRTAIVGYHGLVHDVPVLRDGEEIGALTSPQLVPQPPFRDLWRKWHAYMRLEEIKKGNLSRHEWTQQVLRPQLRGIKWLLWRYYRSVRSCSGRRMPLRYEVGRLAYELGVIVYTGRRFVGIRRADLDRAWD